MKIKTPSLKKRLARLPSTKSNRIGKGRIKRALAKLNPLKKSEQPEPWMPLTPWDAFRELSRIRHEMDRLWSRWPHWPRRDREAMTVAEWSPRVDISEDGKGYLIKAELPGVNKEDVRITVRDGGLSIRGERRTEVEEKGKKLHRREWTYGSFERRFALPPGTDPDSITSEFKDGLLKVHVPKSPDAKSKATQVEIR
jgi:HSP20 family protein